MVKIQVAHRLGFSQSLAVLFIFNYILWLFLPTITTKKYRYVNN